MGRRAREIAPALLCAFGLAVTSGCGDDSASPLPQGPYREPQAVTMEVPDAEVAFRAFLAERGTPLDHLDADRAVDAVLDFYGEHGASDIDDTYGSGDTLLFQWGTYDWGEGPSFEFDLTRQLISTQFEPGDEAIWQLSLTLHYEPDEANDSIGDGRQWCDRTTSLPEFRSFLDAQDATSYARSRRPDRVDLYFSQV